MSKCLENAALRPASLFLLAAILLCICAQSALAEQPFFMGVGNPYDRVEGISGDGSVVVGWTLDGPDTAFRWTKDGGRVELGSHLRAFDASHDGTVIVGRGDGQPFQWTSGGGAIGLGNLPGGIGIIGVANAVTPDGAVAVGITPSVQGFEAFRWTAADGMVGLGDLPGGGFESSAWDVSDNGSTIVGNGTSTSGIEAFRWTSTGGMAGLGSIPGGTTLGTSFLSHASGVSTDGSVVVGWSRSPNTPYFEAFRWTSDGGMVGLGVLPGDNTSRAIAASADGSVIVGHSNRNNTSRLNRSFIWDAVHGMRDLRAVLVDELGLDLTGWGLAETHGISADGRTIVGQEFTNDASWIAYLGPAKVPEPSCWALLSIGVASVFAKRRSSASKAPRQSQRMLHRRAVVERLEDRRVMAADFSSAFSVGGAASENVYDLALDGAGNTCVVGRFVGTVDCDPGTGVYELTSEPSTSSNTFVAKYDPNGSLLWAQRLGGSAANFGPEIAAGNDGSVYVVGSFTGSAEFGGTVLTSVGQDDIFVTKLDAEGHIAWANRFGGTGADWGNDVAIDGAGNVYLMAETRDTGNPDAFFAKMDAAGSVLWSREIGASSSISTKGKTTTSTGWSRGYKLTVDDAGNVYGTGRISGTVDFDAGTGTTAIAGTGFVTKLSTDGDLVWARAFTGANHESHDIAVDAAGNVFTTGLFSNAVDFDPGTGRTQKFILSAFYRGTYVSALDSSGNFLWARSVGGLDTSNWAWPEAMAVDDAGDLYLTGYFVGTVDFNPGSGAYNLTSAGDNDAFVSKLTSAGAFAWAGQMGGASADMARGIGVDSAGNIFVAGVFTGTADFDPGAGTYILTTAGGNDFFVAKFTETGALALSLDASAADAQNAQSTSDDNPALHLAVAIATRDNEAAAKRRSHRAVAVDSALTEFNYRFSDLFLAL